MTNTSTTGNWEAQLINPSGGQASLLNFVVSFNVTNSGPLKITGFGFFNDNTCFAKDFNSQTETGNASFTTDSTGHMTGTLSLKITSSTTGSVLTLTGNPDGLTGTSNGTTTTTGTLSNGVVVGTWTLTPWRDRQRQRLQRGQRSGCDFRDVPECRHLQHGRPHSRKRPRTSRPDSTVLFRSCDPLLYSEDMKCSLQQIAEALGMRLIGDSSLHVTGVASIESASAGDLVFVEDEKHLARALQSGAGAVIAQEFAAATPSSKTLLMTDHPKLAFARAARMLHNPSQQPRSGAVLASAVIHASAVLAPRVFASKRRQLSANAAQIGRDTHIAAGCAIGSGVTIGSECQIYPNVTIYPGTKVGDRVIVHAGAVLGSDGFGYVRDSKTGHYEKFPQVGSLVVEDDVEIGANATIDRGALDETRIRRGAKIDNLVHIGHNCDIGEDVIIAAQTGLSGSIVIENGAVLGGQVGIGEHARIGEGVMLGGQGGVLPNKILRGKGVAFWGTPAQPLRQYLKQLATVARLAKKD